MAFLEGPSRLEQKYSNDYSVWKASPNPKNASRLLKAVQPEIDRGISAHVGRSDPILNSKARKITLQALKTYDPQKARLSTHIVNQLQGLKRIARRQTQVIPIPERVSIDQSHVEQARNALADELGREPSSTELADKTGLSQRRLTYIRRFKYPLAEGTLTYRMSQEDEGGFMPAVDAGDGDSWLEFVYSDLDGTNKKIMEWTLGMHGSKQLSNLAIAKNLRLSPGAISQRKAAIQELINQQQELSPF